MSKKSRAAKRAAEQEAARKRAEEEAKEEQVVDEPKEEAPQPEEPAAEPKTEEEITPPKAEGEVKEEPKVEEPKEEPESEEDEPEEKPKKGFVGTYWMLIAGMLLALAGIIGVVLLRTNIAQVYFFGIKDPYTGLGPQEAMGHGGAIVPYVIGLILMFVWGVRAEVPEPKEEVAEEEIAPKEVPTPEELPPEPPAEWGHEHLPPHHLTAEQKIEHLARTYAQGKISEGLYKENLAKFEAELEAEPKEPKAPEEFGHEHLPPHHLSPEEKVEHLTRAYAEGKISRGLYERDLAKFEEELKKEQMHLPPHHLSAQEKINHLEDAYKMGRISKGTYEKNIVTFNNDLDRENAERARKHEEAMKLPETPATEGDDKTLMQLDSLLEEIEEDEVERKERERKKKEESFEEKILKEIEDLEDL